MLRAMDQPRTELLKDIDAWTQAADDLTAVLAANAEAVAHGRAKIEDGSILVDAIGTMSTAGRFLRMNAALEAFDMARFRLRSSLISLALAEGLSEEELVANLGVQAELAGQVLTELRSGSGRSGS
jgi:hypothetical protein